MRPYSLDLRQKILDVYNESKLTFKELAERFQVSPSFVQKMVYQMKREGSIAPKPYRGRISLWQERHYEALKSLVEEYPNATLAQYQKLFLERTGMATSTPTLCRKLKKLRDMYGTGNQNNHIPN
jgi:transposase